MAKRYQQGIVLHAVRVPQAEDHMYCDAAERVDRVSWRIPLGKMPPAYWLERGLMLPTKPPERPRAA